MRQVSHRNGLLAGSWVVEYKKNFGFQSIRNDAELFETDQQ